MFKRFIASMVASMTLFVAAPAFAVVPVTTFDFSTATSTLLSVGTGASWTVNGVTVTATAWATTGNTVTSLPQQAALGEYSAGLGVTDSAEDGSQNTHTVDNAGMYDFIRLVFSTPVKLTGATIQGFGLNGNPVDTDAWESWGNTSWTPATPATGTSITGSLWQTYLDHGTAVAGTNTGGSFSGAQYSTVWLIGADRSGSDRDDGFKLSTVSVVAVPEPGTWMLMILGFGIVGLGIRRKGKSATSALALGA